MLRYCPGESVELAVLGCKGEAFKSAALTRIRPAGDRLYTELAVQADSYAIKLPDEIFAGVWRLTVHTSCGCRTALIGIDCDKVQMAGQRHVTNLRPAGKVCCE